MRARITPSPKADQWVAVSTVTRPVTQAAEVAVKRAVIGLVRGVGDEEVHQPAGPGTGSTLHG